MYYQVSFTQDGIIKRIYLLNKVQAIKLAQITNGVVISY
jgi:hypothetical protein